MNIFWILALGLAMALHPTPCFRHCRQPVYWLKEINRKRLQIAEIVLSIKKLGTKNQMPVPKFATEVHKQPFLHMRYKNTTSKRPANSNRPRVQRRATICYKLYTRYGFCAVTAFQIGRCWCLSCSRHREVDLLRTIVVRCVFCCRPC